MKTKTVIIILFLCGGFLTLKTNAQQASRIFNDGDTICFVGNSITHAGQYHEFIQLFYATRFPDIKLQFINNGISGDNALNILDRLHSDILIHNPDHVFLMTGMNDVVRTLYFRGAASDAIIKKRKAALERYEDNTTKLVEEFLGQKINTILLTPSIYDQYSKIEKENNFGCNDALIDCSAQLHRLGKQFQLAVIDLNANMKSIMDKGLVKDSLFTIVGKDRVHPGTEGHFIMASKILTDLEPVSVVANMGFDSKSRDLINKENCKIDVTEFSNKALRFRCQENALPFPISKSLEKALSWTNFEKHFNIQKLVVKNLKPGNYKLHIDKILIGTYTGDQLETGINLAHNPKTPQYRQALQVKALCETYRKTAFQLRVIPFIENKFLKAYQGEKTIEALSLYLDEQLEAIAGKPFFNYMKQSVKKYLEALPKQNELHAQLDAIHKSIYTSNKSKTHYWQLVYDD